MFAGNKDFGIFPILVMGIFPNYILSVYYYMLYIWLFYLLNKVKFRFSIIFTYLDTTLSK